MDIYRLAVLQQLQRGFHDRQLRHGVLVLAAGALAGLLGAALEAVEVGEHQLGLDRLGIGDRVDAAFDVGDVVILEAAQHMHDGIHFADVGEELVAEAFTLRRATHEAGDIDEGDARRDDFLRLGNVGKLAHARVRHRHFAGVRLDGAERVVGCLGGRRLGECVEERGLADVRQPDNTAFEAHGVSSVSLNSVGVAMREGRFLVKGGHPVHGK
ncbi:hypothetical protein D9M70_468150 [compost metagenome]